MKLLSFIIDKNKMMMMIDISCSCLFVRYMMTFRAFRVIQEVVTGLEEDCGSLDAKTTHSDPCLKTHRILVHCMRGRSRSTGCCCGVLNVSLSMVFSTILRVCQATTACGQSSSWHSRAIGCLTQPSLWRKSIFSVAIVVLPPAMLTSMQVCSSNRICICISYNHKPSVMCSLIITLKHTEGSPTFVSLSVLRNSDFDSDLDFSFGFWIWIRIRILHVVFFFP